MNACSCLTLILACIVYWQARERTQCWSAATTAKPPSGSSATVVTPATAPPTAALQAQRDLAGRERLIAQ